MPVYIDILENTVLGPAFKRGELTILSPADRKALWRDTELGGGAAGRLARA